MKLSRDQLADYLEVMNEKSGQSNGKRFQNPWLHDLSM